MENIFPLPRPTPPSLKPNKPVIQAGHRYRIDTQNPADSLLGDLEHDLQNGLLGAYQLSTDKAIATAVDIKQSPIQAFVWNSELLNPLLKTCLSIAADHPQQPGQNRLTVLGTSLAGPEVSLVNNTPVLSITPRFELEWATAAYGSQLGVLQLVESTRTAHLANGENIVLLDTEAAHAGPVLYLPGTSSNLPITALGTMQQQGLLDTLLLEHAITQTIPPQIAGSSVASVSVLEKYTVYFMQNAGPEQPKRYIWVPVHLPIVWGWSIRVQQRYDGVWDVFRKKLIMPSASTEAPQLPIWRSNSLLCGTTQAL
ncbi:hypothetical protein ACH50O_05885 [Methylomonas sp. 2BW1-5-20]|uniref:hypothetical protein n=1 Tax=Methylomonas sp. 2BW1-5-20 TaxID=3376686 RepID=UPI00404D4DD6